MAPRNPLTRQRNRRQVAVRDAGVDRAPRVPRRVVRTPKRQFDSMQLVPPDFSGGIVGEIQAIESPTDAYTAYFMNTSNGPAMVVGHLGGEDGIAAPTAATGEELAGDIRQIHGAGPDGRVPDTIVMRVAEGDEAATRDAMRRLVDTLNAEGGPQRDLVERAPQPVDRGTVGLVFSLVPRDGQPDESEASEISDDVPDQPGPGALPGPAVAGAVAAALGGAQAAAGRPDRRDPKDLRSDVPLMHVISLEDFDRATRVRSLRSRTAEYRQLRAALVAYHEGVADYRAAADGIKTQLTALGAGKTALTTELNARKQELADIQSAIQADTTALLDTNMRILELRQARLDAVDAGEMRRIDGEIEAAEAESSRLQQAVTGDGLAARRARVVRLQTEIGDRQASIARIDANLRAQIAANETLLTRHTDELARRAEQIVVDGRAYLLSKGVVDPNDKQRIVTEVVRQVSDPDQHLQRLKEQAGALWGSEFRHQLVRPADRLDTGTASDVFLVETYGNIGESTTRTGYAKRALQKDDPGNDTTTNLGFEVDLQGRVTAAPNLIARQVISSRLARHLELNVIADEVFSADADGRPMGLTAKSAGRQVRVSLGHQTRLGVDGMPRTDRVFEHAHFDLRNNGTLQKALSDLQLMDALTGQLDRHLGNIFIDERGDPPTVTGIDNDMAFAIDRPVAETGNTLGTFVYDGDTKTYSYQQDQIDAGTAARILALEPADLEKILRGRDGRPEREGGPETLKDPEHLDDAAITHAVTRLEMIKTRIRELMPDGLITNWGTDTFDDAIANATRTEFNRTLEMNYVSRIHLAYEAAGDPANVFSQQAQPLGGGAAPPPPPAAPPPPPPAPPPPPPPADTE